MSWFYDDYGDVAEASAADEILEEAKEKLESLIKDEIKAKMEEAKTAEHRLNDISRAIRAREADLEGLKKEIAHANEELEWQEATFPKKFADKYIQSLTGGFRPGDHVWMLKTESVEIKCKTCNGTGKVKFISASDGRESECTCPECRGWPKKATAYTGIQDARITSVYVRMEFEKRGAYAIKTDGQAEPVVECIHIDRHGYESRNYRAEELYKTKEEAEIALKEKQKEDEHRAYYPANPAGAKI